MSENKNIFPRIEIVPVKRIGRAIVGFFQMHQLSEQSDHKFDHPFDAELYDKQEERMKAYWEPYCVPEDIVIKSHE